MTKTEEPLAAILAEIRHRADNYRQDGWESIGEELDDLADRIEAAAERDYEESKNCFAKLHDGPSMICTAKNCAVRNVGLSLAAHGNAAAMREALQKISETIWSQIDPTCNDDCCKPWRELAKIADAALATPARNCDRFANGTEAGIAFRAERHGVDDDAFWPSLVNWLFAPAEGGAE